MESSGKNSSSSLRWFGAGWVDFFHRLGTPQEFLCVRLHTWRFTARPLATRLMASSRLRARSSLSRYSNSSASNSRRRLLSACAATQSLATSHVCEAFRMRNSRGGTYDHWWRRGRADPSWPAHDRRAARRLSRLINSLSYPGGAPSKRGHRNAFWRLTVPVGLSTTAMALSSIAWYRCRMRLSWMPYGVS